MKKSGLLIFAGLLLPLALTGCAGGSELHPKDPVTLTVWHVYGEQADSPMNRLIEEFNQTVGMEKGIILDVTLMSNASDIGEKLLDAQKGMPGVPAMPDLFFCHINNAKELGTENLVDWQDRFSEKELDAYIPEFLHDGMADGRLSVFPVSKSTHMLYISGSQFERFSADTGVSYDSLATWDGFFSAAEKYYDWSGGKPFCAFDYPIRCVELNALAKDSANFYTKDGWYNFKNEIFKASWMEFAQALSKGHIIVSDLYSKTQVMTGEVAAGIGSSASILYYNDTVTYPDNTSEPIDLQVLPIPKAAGKELLTTQAGVGLCSYKTTDQKAEAAAVFAHWLTEGERNLDFCVQTGYMPVNKGSFDKIGEYAFDTAAYKNLYTALSMVYEQAVAVSEPSFTGYYKKIYTLYDALRQMQSGLAQRYQKGEDAEALAAETWDLLQSIR